MEKRFKEGFKNTREWLDYLFYQIGRQRHLEVCGLYKIEENRKSSTWDDYLGVIQKIDEFGDIPSKYNQRSILSNEILLDLEEPQLYEEIIKTLKEENIYFLSWFSGSRGYHISLFFDRDLEEDEKSAIINLFKCDSQKSAKRTMIAMEFKPHWKTNNPKKIVENNLFTSKGDIGYNHMIVHETTSVIDTDLKSYKIVPSEKIGGYT